jgi:hypothetical protein
MTGRGKLTVERALICTLTATDWPGARLATPGTVRY